MNMHNRIQYIKERDLINFRVLTGIKSFVYSLKILQTTTVKIQNTNWERMEPVMALLKGSKDLQFIQDNSSQIHPHIY